MKIFNYPVARITPWYILGVLLAYFFKIPLYFSIISLIVCGLILGYLHFTNNKKSKNKNQFSVVLYTMFLLFGIVNLSLHNPTLQPNHFYNIPNVYNSKVAIQATISERLKPTTKYNRYYVSIQSINNQENIGKVLLQIERDSENLSPKIGQEIFIYEQLVENFKTSNPNQFDYGNYLKTKGVYAQIFTKSSSIKLSEHFNKNFHYYASNYRENIQRELEKSTLSKKNIALFMALLLGQQQDISNETISDYQYAGAVHILSVSGLHVGFVLIFITFLFKKLPNNNRNNTIRIFFSIASLWLFALVAGMSPSVIRSAVMFSFLAVGQFLNRKHAALHTTIVSLFVILLFEPNFLFDIGFQLSYLAVFFILWLQPIFNSWYKPDNKFAKYFWDIITVSFAAQIGTLPLSLYYFHQFPSLFFITNLAIIPVVSIIMGIGCVILVLASFGIVPNFLTSILDFFIGLMNNVIHKIASVESFIWKEIPMSLPTMLWLYVILSSWLLWKFYPSFKKLFWLLITILVLQIGFIYVKYVAQSKDELVVFNIKRKTILGTKFGDSISVLTNDTLVKNGFEEKTIQTFVTANNIEVRSFDILQNTIAFNSKKILVIDEKGVFETNLHPDIVLLSKSPKVNLERVIETHKPKIIIADASNYKTYIDLWRTTCIKKDIPFHSTYEKGYYSIK